MKITKLTTYRVAPRWMFLKIETDEGVTGWGEPVIEGRARTVETAVHELSDYLIGQDPARINDLWQAMYRGGFYRGGPILMSAIAGIDQALWDIKGKVMGKPVYELLGGLVRDRMKMYSWVGGDRPADIIEGIGHLVRNGFDTFKMNGTEELGMIDSAAKVDAAVGRIAEIRGAFGKQIEFGIDFHGRVAGPMAKPLLRELEPFRPLFVEEPVLAEQSEQYRRRRRNHDSAGGRRTHVLALRLQAGVRGRRPCDCPARSVACRRHHRVRAHRRHGRGVRRGAGAPLPARPGGAGGLPAG